MIGLGSGNRRLRNHHRKGVYDKNSLPKSIKVVAQVKLLLGKYMDYFTVITLCHLDFVESYENNKHFIKDIV